MNKHIFALFLILILGSLSAEDFSKELKNLSKKDKVTFLNRKAYENFESNNNKVKEYARRALEIATEINYIDGSAKARYNLTVAKFFDNDSTLVDDFKLLAKEALELKIPSLEADCYFALGNYYINLSSPKALEYYLKSAKIRKESNLIFDLGNSYRFIANYYLLTGDYKQARNFAEKALSIFLKDNRNNQLGFINGLLAEIHKITGNNLESLKYNEKSFIEFKKTNYTFGLIQALINQAEIKADLQRYDEAKATFFEALDEAKNLNSAYITGGIHKKLSEIFLTTGEYDKALEHLKISESKQKDIFVDLSSDISLIYGKIYEKQGKIKKAEQKFKTALNIFTINNQLLGVVKSNLLLGNLYLHHFPDYTKAEPYLKKAFNISKPLGFKVQSDITKSLYKYFKKTGQVSNALFYFEQFHSYENSYRTKENDKELLNLEFRYDNIRLRNEKKIRELESKKIKLELEEKKLQNKVIILSLFVISTLLAWIVYRFLRKRNQLHIMTQEKKILANDFEEFKDKTSEIVDEEKHNSAKATAVTTSHELNQPLQIVSGNIEMLAMKLDNEEKLNDYQKYITKIAESIQRMQLTLQKYEKAKTIRFDEYVDETEMALFEEE